MTLKFARFRGSLLTDYNLFIRYIVLFLFLWVFLPSFYRGNINTKICHIFYFTHRVLREISKTYHVISSPQKGLLRGYQRNALPHKLIWVCDRAMTQYAIQFSPYFFHWVWRSFSGISIYIFHIFSIGFLEELTNILILLMELIKGECWESILVINTITVIGG